MGELHNYAFDVMARPATPTYGINNKKKCPIENVS